MSSNQLNYMGPIILLSFTVTCKQKLCPSVCKVDDTVRRSDPNNFLHLILPSKLIVYRNFSVWLYFL